MFKSKPTKQVISSNPTFMKEFIKLPGLDEKGSKGMKNINSINNKKQVYHTTQEVLKTL